MGFIEEDELNRLIQPLPECPEYIQTAEAQSAWVDLMHTLKLRGDITPLTMEVAKSYIHSVDLSGIAMQEMNIRAVDDNGNPSEWHAVFYSCTQRMIDCAEVLKI